MCGHGATCTNTEGSYACSCPEETIPDPDPYIKCVGIVKCEVDDDCPGNAICDPQKRCLCPEPNVGNDCRRKYDMYIIFFPKILYKSFHMFYIKHRKIIFFFNKISSVRNFLHCSIRSMWRPILRTERSLHAPEWCGDVPLQQRLHRKTWSEGRLSRYRWMRDKSVSSGSNLQQRARLLLVSMSERNDGRSLQRWLPEDQNASCMWS